MTTSNNFDHVDFNKLPKPILADHPELVELYYFAWELAKKSLRYKGERLFVDNAFDPARNYQWVWDTCFVALFSRYGAGMFPGINGLDNFYDQQREDGFISMTYDLNQNREVFPARINPPLFAWAEWEYYRTTSDDSRLERAVTHIERLMDWIDANRLTVPHYKLAAINQPGPRGHADIATYQLYYFEDCGSSGMDDSPRTPRKIDAGKFFDWIDLSSQMALSFDRLSRIHSVLGNAEKSNYWKDRAEKLGALINEELWCEATQFYHDRSIPTNFVGHKTAAGFWPILAGICPPDRLEKLVEHLENENEFNTPTPVPTLSRDDINYSAQGRYWLGGVWAPTNYMITRGLMLCDKGDLAHNIAMKYVSAISRVKENFEPSTIWESYSPEEDKPGISAYSVNWTRPNFVGWSASGPVSMLIENILGVDVDMHSKQVSWTIRLTEEHGIENLFLGAKDNLTLLCERRKSAEDTATVRAVSTMPISLKLIRGKTSNLINLKPGESVTVTV
ncbi:MAG: hypothetical protein GX811_07890 [Lentisphaerae bacterium]|nr:hypothetical protein [Lentisphaerota bacterium]